MNRIAKKERRVQYMLPHQLHIEQRKLSLIFLPLAPLEWHGPHLVLGTDPVIAENSALRVAGRIGGVVMPTLYMGTERERPPEMLCSLGFKKTDYVVGMDFPKAKGLYNSIYFPEEVFGLVVKAHVEQCIRHKYRYICIINGHGAVNHNETLTRICIECCNMQTESKVFHFMACPDEELRKGLLAHAGIDEVSRMMYFNSNYVDLSQLPPAGTPIRYSEYSIVDSGGFTGKPGKGHCLPESSDPRKFSSAKKGKNYFEKSVNDLVRKIKTAMEDNKQ